MIKDDLIAKLHNLERKEERGGISVNRRREKVSFRYNSEEIAFKETISRRQKMKFMCVKEGDANLKLFHNVVSNRRNRKRV